MLILPPWDEIFANPWIGYVHQSFLSGIEAAFQQFNFSLRTLSLSTKLSLKELERWAHRIRTEHDGFLCIVSDLEPLVRELFNQGFPVVSYYQKYLIPGLSHCDFDRRAATYNSTDHLIRLGRCRIGLFGRTLREKFAGPGFDGYLGALADHGLDFDSRLLLRTDRINDAPYWRYMVKQAIREKRLGDAIVAEITRTGQVTVRRSRRGA